MKRKGKRVNTESAIAASIAARRNQFVSQLDMLQSKADKLSIRKKAEQRQIASSNKKIASTRKTLTQLDQVLAKQTRQAEATDAEIGKAQADIASVSGKLAEFDNRLKELVDIASVTVAGGPRRKRADAGVKRGPRAAKAKTAGAAGKAAKAEPSKGRQKQGRRGPTQADLIMNAMSDQRGLSVEAILARVESRSGKSIQKRSAATMLSLLKRNGQVTRDSDGWRLIRKSSGSSTGTSATSVDVKVTSITPPASKDGTSES